MGIFWGWRRTKLVWKENQWSLQDRLTRKEIAYTNSEIDYPIGQWLTSTRNPSSIGNPSTVFFRSISTDGCRAARPLDLVLVDWDWVT